MTTLSASSVNTFEQCRLQWYFEYVEMRPQPPYEPRDTGIKVHDYAEARLKGEDITVLEKPDVIAAMEVFDRDILPTYAEPVLVEAAFELDVEGVPYTGFIDSVDLHPVKVEEATFSEYWAKEIAGSYPTGYILRDLKTTSRRPRPGRYRFNNVGYWLGARELGFRPDSILLDYIVRTRAPYYWPEEQEVPDDDEIDVWAAKVVRTADRIEEGDFGATGIGTTACASCPFKDICGPYDRWKELTSPLRKD